MASQNLDKVSATSCRDENSNPRFVDNGDGTITDRATQLMWAQRDSRLELNHLVSWHKGQEYVKEKNAARFAGYQDWRFPTGSEAKELFDTEASNTDWEGCEVHLDPVFPKGCGHTTWTSETRGAKSVMGYDYRADYEYWLAKENDGFPSSVRLVRDVRTALVQEKKRELADNGDGTISDFQTGLMWKKSDSYLDLDKWVSWDEAKTYCQDLSKQEFAGHDDWRMPTRKEAMSIYDPGHPTKDIYGDVVFLQEIFPPGAGITTWTKTLSKEDKTVAMRVHYYNGDYKWYGRGLRSHGVRAVRVFATGKTETSESE